MQHDRHSTDNLRQAVLTLRSELRRRRPPADEIAPAPPEARRAPLDEEPLFVYTDEQGRGHPLF